MGKRSIGFAMMGLVLGAVIGGIGLGHSLETILTGLAINHSLLAYVVLVVWLLKKEDKK